MVNRAKKWRNHIALMGVLSLCLFLMPSSEAFAQQFGQPNGNGECFFKVISGTSTEEFKGACTGDSKAGETIVINRLATATWTEMIYNTLSSLGAVMAWLGGSLLDISISNFTVGMAKTADNWGFTATIYALWSVVRDLFNILFIFGLIWAGLKMILGIDDSGSKKMIVSIIVAALLINFSLYATQVVIDFTNVAAHQIHSAIRPAEGSPEGTAFGAKVTGIANNFVYMSDLDSLRENSAQIAEKEKLSTDSFAGSLIMGIVMLAFYGLLGFVFAAGAFILFSRFIALLFLMIFSPVLFLGWILPGMRSISSKWTQYLFKQALIGPAFLFMLYIALRAMQGMGKVSADSTIAGTMVYVLIVAAFVIAALKAAQSMSNWGSMQAYNVGDLAFRQISSAAGRNTAGRLGDWYNRRLDERGVIDTSLRRKLASSLAGSKFGGSTSRADARASEEKASQKRARFDQLHGTPQRIPGTNMAVPYTRGRKGAGVVQNISKGGSEMEGAIAGASNEQLIELLGKYGKKDPEYQAIVANMSAGQFEAAMKAKPDELDDVAKRDLKDARTMAMQKVLREAAVNKALDKDKNDVITVDSDRAIQEGIQEAKDYQLKALGVDTLVKNAAYLKQSQFDEIMKANKDYTPTDQSRIREARKKGLIARFEDDQERPKMFKGMQDKDMASLPKEILLDENARAVQYLTGGALRKIAEDDKLAETDRVKLRDNILVREGIDAKSSALKYLRSPQGQEKYGERPE